MNVGGGEAADQMVRMMLSGTEVAVRLSGSALKNLLALTMALARNRKTISGKVNMSKMLRQTRDLRRFPMTPQQYKQFRKMAKKHKLLYSVIKDKDEKGKLMDVLLPVTELDRANTIFERILYTMPPEPERKPAKALQKGREVFQPERQAQERQEPEYVPDRRQEHQPREQQQKEMASPREKPSRLWPSRREAERGRQEDTGKNASRSGRDSPGIKTSSSTRRESSTAKGMSERSSIEARLQWYRAQMKKPPVPVKTKVKDKVRPKAR